MHANLHNRDQRVQFAKYVGNSAQNELNKRRDFMFQEGSSPRMKFACIRKCMSSHTCSKIVPVLN